MTFKRQIVFSYDQSTLIEYPPLFKIHKCPADFPQPEFLMAHHPYFIDFQTEEVSERFGISNFHYSLNEKPKIDDFPKSPIPKFVSQIHRDNQIKHEILLLVNILTDKRFFQYDKVVQSWSIINEGEKLKSVFAQQGYIAPDSFEDVVDIVPEENYNYTDPILLIFNNAKGEISHQVRLKEILDTYYNSKNVVLKQAFLNACHVFNRGLELAVLDKSASYIFLISAIESLIEFENKEVKFEKCVTCDSVQYQVMKKFKGFIDKYGYAVENKVKNEFYQMRSDIAHKGKLFESSYPFMSEIETQEDFERTHERTLQGIKYDNFIHLAKVCFRTFILFNLNEKYISNNI